MPPSEADGTREEFILGPPPDPGSPSERFYAGAIGRIYRAILLIGCVGSAAALIWSGPRQAVGFVLGTLLSAWSFRSLVSAVTALAARIVEQHEPASGASIVTRFIVRIPLVALAGYAIFISSPGSLRGFVVGLCVPVAALLCEAGYEAFAATRRGF